MIVCSCLITMEKVPLDLFMKNPTFKCVKSGESSVYSGTLFVNASRFKITVRETIINDEPKYDIINNEDLKPFRTSCEQLTKKKVKSITSLIVDLEEIIRQHSTIVENHSHLYKRILDEYSEFIKFYIDLKSSTLSHDLSSIKVSSLDERRREHQLVIGVDYAESKKIFFMKEFDLPIEKLKASTEKSSSLIEIYNTFLGYVEGLQLYLYLLDEIDQNCKVIDGINQSRKCNARRIWLGENVCVIITIDPFNVNLCPNFTFLGPDRIIDSYRQKLNENLDKWNPNSEDVFQEILNVLGIPNFPGTEKNSTELEGKQQLLFDNGDCSICFSSDLNGKLTDIVCSNECCGHYYHSECLKEWLLSTSSKKIFNKIQGPCPNCEKMISC